MSLKSETEEMSKEILPFHDHPITIAKCKEDWACTLCPSWGNHGIVYRCTACELVLHEHCVQSLYKSRFKCNHPPKLFLASQSQGENLHCHFCRKNLSSLFARCKICNINMDVECFGSPPPREIFQRKHHKHRLVLLLRLVTFTCNACGLVDDRNPYVCLECNLMVHKDCTDLPRVITINRHDHRISHTFHLGEENKDLDCGVCRKTIDWAYGAFKCSRCPHYAVHSKCATRKEVWDGRELENVAEEEEEIEDPYKVINETDIIHFSHEEHILRLAENCVITDIRCEGCVLPINDDPRYKCLECDFILHKECANLPRTKQDLLHNHKLRLLCYSESCFKCQGCEETLSNRFRYICQGPCKDKPVYDVRCCSVSEPFHHDLHPHPLYWTLEGSKQCKACGKETKNPLCCIVCEYALCMKCTTLPKKVKQLRCDDHFLTLRQGVGKSRGDLWCDICEYKTDPSKRYYTCDECGVTLHIDCVLGEYYYVKPGTIAKGVEVIANKGATRPTCFGCEARCKAPLLVKYTRDEHVLSFCNKACMLIPK